MYEARLLVLSAWCQERAELRKRVAFKPAERLAKPTNGAYKPKRQAWAWRSTEGGTGIQQKDRVDFFFSTWFSGLTNYVGIPAHHMW